jgi:UDPglucose 6-dehydrogenase
VMEELWKEGASIQAFDPVAMKEAAHIYGERADLKLVSSALEAVKGADALVIITEWQEFRSPDFDQLKESLKTPTIFDGRNLYNPELVERFGFTYYPIGRAKRQIVPRRRATDFV